MENKVERENKEIKEIQRKQRVIKEDEKPEIETCKENYKGDRL